MNHEEDAASATRPRRLLLADDDDDFRVAAAELLRLDGWEVIECSDGSTALEQALGQDLDLVLLDHRMPSLLGGDVYRSLRHERPGLPVVLMTAALDPERLAREVGAPEVLNKPFDVGELREAMDRALATRDRLKSGE
jgi:CheY-like chemotaxis protein